MIIKPKILRGIAVSTHPVGCKKEVENEQDLVLSRGSYKAGKKVLVIGASSGYGLASRISLAFGAGSDTIGISFEQGPTGKRQGTPGWWNNIFFKQLAEKQGLMAKNFIGDAFSDTMREDVIQYVKEEFGGKLDLVIYSVAAPKRLDPRTNTLYSSCLKGINQSVTGPTINLDNGELTEGTMPVATEEEIEGTVKVMGGEDWQYWIEALKEADVLNSGFKTVAYSYIGPEATAAIYKDGTIGAAKRDLEEKAKQIDALVKPFNGEAFVSVNKAVMTKASAFIPLFSLYAAVMYRVMKEQNVHENCIEQTDRFLRDMLYGEKREIDAEGRLRPDSWELSSKVQDRVNEITPHITKENFQSDTDYEGMYQDFMILNGFCVDGVDYDADVDMSEFENLTY